jgi:CRP/FNR family cyclic AMP-dependent transcriptional regulator
VPNRRQTVPPAPTDKNERPVIDITNAQERGTADMLNKLPLCETLGENELDTLSRNLRPRNYRKNTIIFEAGDPGDMLYIVETGQVKAYLSDDQGKEIVLSVLGPGDYFGEMALLDDAPRSASVITAEPSRLLVMSGSDFRATLARQPEIALQVIRGLNETLRRSTENVKSLALRDVYGRVTRLLHDLAVDEDGRRVINERLTHQDIADRVGSSREAITRILKDLRTGGYVAIEGRRIEILADFPRAW